MCRKGSYCAGDRTPFPTPTPPVLGFRQRSPTHPKTRRADLKPVERLRGVEIGKGSRRTRDDAVEGICEAYRHTRQARHTQTHTQTPTHLRARTHSKIYKISPCTVIFNILLKIYYTRTPTHAYSIIIYYMSLHARVHAHAIVWNILKSKPFFSFVNL